MGYHGKPDWGLQLKKTVYTFDDLSELAVRLGSESFFDRRGDVYFIDSFENGLNKWDLDGSGDGKKQELIADRAVTGGYCLKLTGGKTQHYYSIMTNYFPYPVLSKWGFEVHFSIPAYVDYILFNITLSTGTHYVYATIKYDDANDKLQYEDTAGHYKDIKTDLSLYNESYMFNVLKLVTDLENSKYHRLILNNKTYDLSAHDMIATEKKVAKHILVWAAVYSRKGYNDYAYFDNIIVTQNEP